MISVAEKLGVEHSVMENHKSRIWALTGAFESAELKHKSTSIE